MGKQFLDDDTLYRFVSSQYHAKCIENEAGVGMSWADMGGSEELEEALSTLSEKEQKKFEEHLENAASDSGIASCFEEMNELIHIGEDAEDEEDDETEEDDEDKLQRLRELQSDVMDLIKEQLGEYLK